ncbi:hypothetical protein BC941DRAFT_423009 [Chlamydoabsidia padenii]|nr:hypothetical protein BC941DRAFT_423009 [Chlamydoabsidia padenii]
MAPLVLKLHTNLFDDLTIDPDELHDTWRVCTKAKKALEHGSRLENISWRRWFLQVQKQQQKQPSTTKQDNQVTSLTLLEQQYKRNLLAQQKKQCERILQATATKPADFVDNQYQPPPISTASSTCSSSNSSDILTTLDEDTCLLDPYKMSSTSTFDDDMIATYTIHPAMYVASDEPSFVQQHNSICFQQPMHTLPTFDNTTASSSSTLASYLTTKHYHHHQHHHEQNNNIKIKKKPKKYRVRCPLPVVHTDGNSKSVCDDCGTSSTPLWRRYQNKNLCNACGLYWKLHNLPRPIHLIPSTNNTSVTHQEESNNQIPQCTNCGTMTTPLWRRNEIDGSPLCNACGLYAKLHQETRPLSMKTNVIKKRQRLS